MKLTFLFGKHHAGYYSQSSKIIKTFCDFIGQLKYKKKNEYFIGQTKNEGPYGTYI